MPHSLRFARTSFCAGGLRATPRGVPCSIEVLVSLVGAPEIWGNKNSDAFEPLIDACYECLHAVIANGKKNDAFMEVRSSDAHTAASPRFRGGGSLKAPRFRRRLQMTDSLTGP
jgi:hypothetical protein